MLLSSLKPLEIESHLGKLKL